MAIITRVRGRQTTPDASLDRYEAHTIKKTQFFNAYDEHYNSKPLTVIAEDAGTTRTTATRWLEERREHGRVAYRSNRKKSKKLGRKPKLLKERVRELCDKEKNPVRDQQYEAQIKFYSLRVYLRTIQRALKKYTNKGQRYKQAYFKKEIIKKNKNLQEKCRDRHEDKTIDRFWKFKLFTDKVHVSPTSQSQGFILRKQPPFGDRYNPDNIQKKE
jgi:hypothetical protein